MPTETGSELISPTAHYTGWVWTRNGLGHPALGTLQGRVLYEAMRPLNLAAGALAGVSLEPYLLARHRAIDAVLSRAIDAGEVSQVIELACGLSPRGWRFANRYGERIAYIETDLPGMAARKHAALKRIGSLCERHRVVELDALAGSGPRSLAAVAGTLAQDKGTAIITEGLLSYLDADALEAIWERIARTLGRFPNGLYMSDLHLSDVGEGPPLRVGPIALRRPLGPPVRLFRWGLETFVRGRVTLHFASAAGARERLLACGFQSATVRSARELPGARPGGSELVHIIEASTSRSP